MDEFLNNNTENQTNTENNEVSAVRSELHNEQMPNNEETVSAEENRDEANTAESENSFKTANERAPIYNPVRYSPVEPVNDYKPMSLGLKVFALIMAAVILLTAACVTGYFLGRNQNVNQFGETSVDLAARPADTDEMTAAQVYDKVNPSVVGIVVYSSNGNSSQASGIVYSEDGYIITNDHIYSEIASPKFKIFTHDGTQYEAEYVAGDQISDLAVLKVKSAKLEPAVFGNSNEIYHGQNVVAIGRPGDATTDSSVTSGIISAVSRRVQTTSDYSARLIETTSAINPGSSGGALVNMYGQVVGVTSSKLVSDVYDNVGYAIPTTTMKRIAEELISEGKVVSRAKLGITYTEVNSVTAEINNYDHIGIRIASISEDSDLYGKLGEGDTITHINGIEITADDIVLNIIEQSSAGDKITVTAITAEGQTKTLEAVLKANVSVSSYIAGEASSNNGSGGGTFDFPFGE